MANIYKMIEKEIEKGNTLVSTGGDFLNADKLETSIKKSYVEALKKGEIDFNVSYPEYKESALKTYTEANEITKALLEKGILVNYPLPEMPEPEVKAE